MEPITPQRSSLGVRVGLIGLGLAIVFGAVLGVELLTGGHKEGSELIAAPSPMIPPSISGYTIRQLPDVPPSLADALRTSGIAVEGLSGASISVRGHDANLLAARVPSQDAKRTTFRTGVLEGAASSIGIDLAAHPFRYQIKGGVVFYATEAEAGALTVWFFKDGFEQLYVPPEIAPESAEIVNAIVQAQLVQLGAGPT